MSDSTDASNVLPFSNPQRAAREPLHQLLAPLAKEYEPTTVGGVIAEYEEDEDGIHFRSIKFEFETQCQPMVPPPTELVAKTIAAFASTFARMSQYSSRDTYGEGSFSWDITNNRLENSHSILTELHPPIPDRNY